MNNNQTDNGRIPPQAPDVERYVLGAILLDKDAITNVLEIIDDKDFYVPLNRNLFAVMKSLFEKDAPIDQVTVYEELRRDGKADNDTAMYLLDLTKNYTTSARIEYHAKIIQEKAILRNMITVGSDIVQRCYSDEEETLELLDVAQAEILKVADRGIVKAFTELREAIHQAFEKFQSIHGKHEGITGVPSGFQRLDELTGGWQDSDLIIVAGRPSQGKTALALALARHAALNKIKPTSVAVFSLEMSEEQLVTRMMSAEARINSHQLRTGRLPEEGWRRLSQNVARLAEAPILIDDSSSSNILTIRAKARRLKADKNIGLIIVDYMQLIPGTNRNDSRERQISEISRSLKSLAKDLNIPIIALSQLNRALELRTDRRPALSDLRESGAIEQDADVVIFVHRPESYGIKTIKDWRGQEIPSEGVAEIIIGKQRNGPTDVALLSFVKQYAGFENLSQMELPLEPPPELKLPYKDSVEEPMPF